MTNHQWLERLDARFARTLLAHLPTPLEYLPNLTKHLDGPRIYIKRDDLTGLALGGDKPRKLEYLIGDAIKQRADVLLTMGSSQSNHVRLTAAAARKVGLEVIAFMLEDEHVRNTGNLFLSRLLGAELRFHKVANDDHWGLVPFMDEEAEKLRREGRRPYVIPVSGTSAIGCLGYVRCAFELEEQFSEMEINPTVMYVTCGTGGNIASLMTGFKVIGRKLPIVGISVNRRKDEATAMVRKWTAELRELIGVEGDAEFEIDDGFLGEGYGKLTEAAKEAIKVAARTDGIFLDPVYTGKTMAGLVGHVKQGRLTKKDTVVMIHTGGVPALFAYAEELV